jgi:hypothetical protein
VESSKTYHILNLGAGVQSTALYLMFLNGEVEDKLDYAVFADTQEEPESVYKHIAWLRSLDGPPILTDTAGKLGDDLIHARAKGDVAISWRSQRGRCYFLAEPKGTLLASQRGRCYFLA